MNIDASDIPDPVVLQFIDNIETVINPDSFEIDNDVTSAKLIGNGMSQVRTIHEPADQDFIKINIPKEVDHLVVQATSDPSSGNVRIYLLDENQNELSNERDEMVERELIDPQFSHLKVNTL